MPRCCCKDKAKSIIVKGAAWINQANYGTTEKKISSNYNNIDDLYVKLKQEKVFLFPVKNFARFDFVSKMTCCLVALALGDANIAYQKDCKQNIGIIGTNSQGAIEANREYFKDYVVNGRKSSRANLFIYTLATSHLAEAAIHFKLQGPLFYESSFDISFSRLLQDAKGILRGSDMQNILVVENDQEKSACFVLSVDESVKGVSCG